MKSIGVAYIKKAQWNSPKAVFVLQGKYFPSNLLCTLRRQENDIGKYKKKQKEGTAVLDKEKS